MDEPKRDYLEPLPETEIERLKQRNPIKDLLTPREYEQLMRQNKRQFEESLT